MHGLTQRQSKFLNLLLKNESFVPIKDYAAILGISERTAHKDLKQLEIFVLSKKAVIEKVPRKGIFLTNKDYLEEAVSNQSEYQINEWNHSPFERQILIAKDLLIHSETLSYQLLSEKFLVSKTSIANDFLQIERMIKSSDVTLVSDNLGTRIVGKESNIQKAIKNFAYSIIEQADQANDFRLKFPELCYQFLAREMVEKITFLLQHNQNFNIEKLSDNYFQSLILSTSILLIRIKNGFHLEKQDYFLFEDVESLKTYLLTKELVDQLQSETDFKMTENDFDYLNKQLIAHGFEPKLKDFILKEQYDALVKKIIADMSISVKIDLTNDQQLYSNLMYHLISMIYRLKMNIPVKNPLLAEIKSEYSVLYSTTWLILTKVETELAIQIPEDEIAFIMIHFQGAIDRASKNKKILIVCPTGIGTSELIANRMRRILFPQDILEVVSLRTFYQRDLSNVDLVISPVKINQSSVPVVYVSALMSKEDLKKVSSMYLDLFYDQIEPQPVKKFVSLGKIIDARLIYLNKNFSSKEECIARISQDLLKFDLVTADFEKSIWEREKLGVTDLPTGAAIPHPPPEVVKESRLVVMTLEKSIRWHTRMINTILMICIAEEDLKSVKSMLSELYSIVESKKTIELLFFNKSKKAVFIELGGKIFD